MKHHPLDQLATLQSELKRRGYCYHIKTENGGFDFIHEHGKSCIAICGNYAGAMSFVESLPCKE
jgi:hypothetical protein